MRATACGSIISGAPATRLESPRLLLMEVVVGQQDAHFLSTGLRSTNGRFCAGPSRTRWSAAPECPTNHLNNSYRTTRPSRDCCAGLGLVQVKQRPRPCPVLQQMNRSGLTGHSIAAAYWSVDQYFLSGDQRRARGTSRRPSGAPMSRSGTAARRASHCKRARATSSLSEKQCSKR